MAQFDKKQNVEADDSTSGGAKVPTCPKCGSRKTTIAGTIPGHVWLRCDECGFNFSTDTDPDA